VSACVSQTYTITHQHTAGGDEHDYKIPTIRYNLYASWKILGYQSCC